MAATQGSEFAVEELFFSTTDRKGVIRSCNRVFERVSGYSESELLGGSVSVRSTLGTGSTFSLTIPLVYRDPIGHPQVGSLQPGRAAVLVVEDNDADMVLYERALAATRFQLVPARSLSAARATLDAMRPAAIILDIRLFGEDSWHWLARLKREPATKSIPIIMITSRTADKHRNHAIEIGVNEYMGKPYQEDQLLALIRRYTQERAFA